MQLEYRLDILKTYIDKIVHQTWIFWKLTILPEITTFRDVGNRTNHQIEVRRIV